MEIVTYFSWFVMAVLIFLAFRKILDPRTEPEQEMFEVIVEPQKGPVQGNACLSEEIGVYYESENGFSYRYKDNGVAMVAFSKSFQALVDHHQDNANTL